MQFAPVRLYPVGGTNEVGIHMVVTEVRIAEITTGDSDRIGLRSNIHVSVHAVRQYATVNGNMHRMVHSQEVVSAHIYSPRSLQPQSADSDITAMRELDASGGTERRK